MPRSAASAPQATIDSLPYARGVLLVATRNLHKLVEIREGLQIPGLVLLGLDALADPSLFPNGRRFAKIPEVVEDGETFEANARKKAVTLSRFSGLWTLADDSGLEVEALHGAPGVHSARFAGEHGNDAANNALLLKLLEHGANRRARFRCVLALCAPDGNCRCVEGAIAGQIAPRPRGKNGFGYDPLFIPEGFRGTFGQLSPKTKRRISHRAQALQTARGAWREPLRYLATGSPGA